MQTDTTYVTPEELESLQLFQGVQLEPLGEDLTACSVREIEAGETLIARGQTNAYLYLLISGRLRVYLDTMGETLSMIEAGQGVGEISIIDKLPTTAHVVAETRCRLLSIEEEVLWSMVSKSHAISINLLSLLAGRLRYSNARLLESQEHERELKYKSAVDPLTGLYNRRWLDVELPDRMTVASEVEQPLSLVVIGLDNFEQYSDDNGDVAGERVLNGVAQSLLNDIRPMDTAVNLGGKKFLVILPDTDLPTAIQVAEDLRLIVKATQFCTVDGENLPPVTISAGVSVMHNDEGMETFLQRAEKALQEAKVAGRNSVSAEGEKVA